MLDLYCCAQAFSSCSEQGLLFVGVQGFLIAVASLTAELRVRCMGSVVAALGLQSEDSVVLVYKLSCPMACGILLDQELNLYSVLWQVDS